MDILPNMNIKRVGRIRMIMIIGEDKILLCSRTDKVGSVKLKELL